MYDFCLVPRGLVLLAVAGLTSTALAADPPPFETCCFITEARSVDLSASFQVRFDGLIVDAIRSRGAANSTASGTLTLQPAFLGSCAVSYGDPCVPNGSLSDGFVCDTTPFYTIGGMTVSSESTVVGEAPGSTGCTRASADVLADRFSTTASLRWTPLRYSRSVHRGVTITPPIIVGDPQTRERADASFATASSDTLYFLNSPTDADDRLLLSLSASGIASSESSSGGTQCGTAGFTSVTGIGASIEFAIYVGTGGSAATLLAAGETVIAPAVTVDGNGNAVGSAGISIPPSLASLTSADNVPIAQDVDIEQSTGPGYALIVVQSFLASPLGGLQLFLPEGIDTVRVVINANPLGEPATTLCAAPCSIADVTGIGGLPADPDGQLTGDDFNAFLAAFAVSDASIADVTGIGGPPSLPDGGVSGDDFLAFLAAFADGCP